MWNLRLISKNEKSKEAINEKVIYSSSVIEFVVMLYIL